MILGCVCDLDITGDGTDITSDAAVDVAVGTTDEDTDATLDSTEADIIAKSDEDLTSDTAEVAIANAAAVKVGASQAIYLNFGVPNADISDDGVITVQGTVEITYVRLGANA